MPSSKQPIDLDLPKQRPGPSPLPKTADNSRATAAETARWQGIADAATSRFSSYSPPGDLRETGTEYRFRSTPSSGIANGALPRSSSKADVDAFIRANYGYFAGFLDNPDIGPILREAALLDWDQSKLYGAVYSTDWWQNTSAAARTWDVLANEDPAEARRLLGQTAATIQNRVSSLGISMSGSQIAEIASQATINGWTDAQVIDNLMGQINWATIEAGDLTAHRDDVLAIGAEYLVGVNPSTAQNYAAKIASGEMTADGVRSAMKNQAKARFSWMSDELDAGITVRDYLAPVQNVIASELGMAFDEIDLSDSRWLSMVETRGDDGKFRAATLDEAMLKSRKQPEWANTSKAKETTNELVGMIGSMFGRS